MTIIVLTDPEQASLAGEWAVANLADKRWNLDVQHLFTKCPEYHFSFTHKKDATLFSLKWL